ncbi:hypothetical protein JMF89_04555 [Clostridiaceae bacterium UIB06]|uniref:Uncharacterized protein n=1 Tax=Clostridium thailandense TaxID=2794346 RepID=A0A949TG86_9CLOT|nr:hypothetical protein [Clostridium thailandense]MBV7272229.1 hypothetical protein [Clostridium thailandense]MCH5136486.1 hypothetical protein [Clostridiaceae bacterium UIB06]
MSNDEKILMSQQFIDKLRISLNTIKLTTKDKNIKKESEDLIKLLENELNAEELTVEQKILKRMRETKNVDPDANANLYILHRKLVNKQITEKEALQILEVYVKTENLDTKFIY